MRVIRGKRPAAPVQPAASFDAPEPGAIADLARVHALLVAAARRGRAMRYSEVLLALGHRFTRPKMRALCRALDAIDQAAGDAGQPELAVLVVREADGLPGQGWWSEGRPARHGYDGPWTGRDAGAFVRALQAQASDFWRSAPADADVRAASLIRTAGVRP